MKLRVAEVFEPKNAKSVLDFVVELSKTPFQGAKIGQAFDVMKEMFIHNRGFNVLTLAGAMTPAKMSRVIIEMVERNWVHAIVSTGALMAHGLVEGQNMDHYHVPFGVRDTELAKKKLNRIFTVLEPETNFQATSTLLYEHIFPRFSGQKDVPPSAITHAIGAHLHKTFPDHPSILGSCSRHGIPVFIPAWTDSELAIEKYAYDLLCAKNRGKTFLISEEIDHRFYTEIISKVHRCGDKLGIFTIGGGVPRNWAQQVGPTLEVIGYTIGNKEAKRRGLEQDVMFSYGVRITTATPEDGGLSGCLYEEGKSWRKFYPDARTAELYPCDATLYWPLLVTALCQYEQLMPTSRRDHRAHDMIQR